ncbi:radical SAM protein [Ursidibacter arcticus]
MNESLEKIQFLFPSKEDLNKNSTNTLIINITDNCNLRCSYCAYSEHYPFERDHNTNSISLEYAKKAIDEYLKRSTHLQTRLINLYGGEPTLHFSLIKDIINYSKTKSENIQFSINTNAYSLTNNQINFLINENVLLQISIDGSKTRHDKYRVNIKGDGTFDKIKNNLKKIYDKSIEYYKNNIVFIATLAPPYQLIELYNLYNSDSLFKNPWYINYVKPLDTTFLDAISLKNSREIFKEQEKFLAEEYISSAINNKAKDHFGHWFFNKELLKVHFRNMSPSSKEWINGCCRPGIDKFFVDSKGFYYPCERSGDFMNIGNVHSGLRPNNSYSIIKAYADDCQNCANCPNVRFCDTCYLGAKRGYELDVSRKYELCHLRIEKLKMILYIYTSVLEKNPNGFDYLNYIEQV